MTFQIFSYFIRKKLLETILIKVHRYINYLQLIWVYWYGMNNNKETQDKFIKACQIFFPQTSVQQLQFYDIKGGVNNWTKGVICPKGDFVVRIYNNGKNIEKVLLQHQLLLILEKTPKSFKTPVPIKIPNSDSTIGLLKEGYPCCLIQKIQGSLPKQITKLGLQNFGQSVSELSNIFSKIKLSKEPVIKPYYDLFAVHPSAVSRQVIQNELSSVKYNSVRDSVNKLLQYINIILQKIQSFHDSHFPVQLIHGDVHTDNILMEGDKMTGILDFQFVALDWRAIQFAICLSKYVNLENFTEIAKDFNRGYKKNKEGLTKIELSAIPWLIVLRLVSNFIYFVGRVMAGEQTLDLCKQKIVLYHQRINKLIPKIEVYQQILLQE